MGLHFDGALVEEIRIPEEKMFKLGPNTEPQVGAYAEPIAASLATSRLPLKGKGAIYGNNRIASLTQLILESRGISIPILDENDPMEEDTFDYLIETILRPGDGNKLCWAVKPHGTIVLKSRKAEEVSFPVGVIVLKDITLQGVSYGDWHSVIPWIEFNHSRIKPLLGKTFTFARAAEAFAEASKAEANKVFIKVS